jgi:uncharacterized protein YjbI with pentapeptide repeats
MANPNHVKLVGQGIAAIRAWLDKYPNRTLDLAGAHLEGAHLAGLDLWGAHLRGANLWGAHLERADLGRADLEEADLGRAHLEQANLWGAHLEKTHLEEAYLERAHLAEAHLGRALLARADLRGADLWRAYLVQADLAGADLAGAGLAEACLIEARLDYGTITDACLWETQRAGWSIQGIICEAVYWDRGDRSRAARTTYAPGEFERLYADKTKIVLHYEGGIRPIEIVTLPALIQQMEERYPGCVLRLRSIEDGPGGVTVTLVVDNRGDVTPTEINTMRAELEEAGRRLISAERRALKAEVQRQMADHTLEYLSDTILPALIKNIQPNYSWEIQKMGDINIAGQVGGVQGRGGHAHDMTFTQLWNQSGPHNDLRALATQLATLRQHLRQAAVEPEHDAAIGAIAQAEMAAKEGNGPQVLEQLSKAGRWALDNAEKIGVGVATEALKTALGL